MLLEPSPAVFFFPAATMLLPPSALWLSAFLLVVLTLWELPKDVSAGSWDRMASITPKGYVSYFTTEPPQIDGRLDEPAWQNVPWTDSFVDIEGDLQPNPRFETRAAIMWDESYLYFAARMEEPHVWGTLTEKNSVIFQDNDFEIFIDPDGDHHNYYEFEVNALNTIWELTMEKPYRDGGPAVSPTNIEGLLSAVHVEGTLNDPRDRDTGWSVEVAIPWAGLARYSPRPVPPQDGERWRMNFSRVAWKHETDDNSYRKVPDTPENNWVWSPQGVVDMHRPERWGYVQFSRNRETPFRPDSTLPLRDALMEVYYAQRAFHAEHKRWARGKDELARVPDGIQMDAAADGWTARKSDGDVVLEVNHLSQLRIVANP